MALRTRDAARLGSRRKDQGTRDKVGNGGAPKARRVGTFRTESSLYFDGPLTPLNGYDLWKMWSAGSDPESSVPFDDAPNFDESQSDVLISNRSDPPYLPTQRFDFQNPSGLQQVRHHRLSESWMMSFRMGLTRDDTQTGKRRDTRERRATHRPKHDILMPRVCIGALNLHPLACHMIILLPAEFTKSTIKLNPLTTLQWTSNSK